MAHGANQKKGGGRKRSAATATPPETPAGTCGRSPEAAKTKIIMDSGDKHKQHPLSRITKDGNAGQNTIMTPPARQPQVGQYVQITHPLMQYPHVPADRTIAAVITKVVGWHKINVQMMWDQADLTADQPKFLEGICHENLGAMVGDSNYRWQYPSEPARTETENEPE